MSLNIQHLLTFCMWIAVGFAGEIDHKICSSTPESSACQQVERFSVLECNYNFHNVDCLLNIESNKSHLGRITGDDAVLGANLLSDNVVVLAEINTGYPPSQIVVIAKNIVPNDFGNLKGRKMCLPGYANDESFPHYLLQELENKVVDLNHTQCYENVTLLERHISTLSHFFGDSCRPGVWSQQPKTDAKLKKRYNSLCKLCKNASCDQQYEDPFSESLQCLTKYDADVALTTLHDAELFFNISSNAGKYKYLCKNGSSNAYTDPCVWSSKLNDLLVAERAAANAMETLLRDNLKSLINSTKISTGNGKVTEALTVLLNVNKENITFLEQYSGYRSLKQYVEDHTNVPSPNDSIQCNRTLRWCTYSDQEQEKCNWLAHAGVIWAIQPVVQCVRSEDNSEISCLDDIKRDRSDIVVASSDYAYITLNKGLKSIAFPETNTRNLSVVLAVKRADDETIKSFNDLKNNKACIPRFGGKEHIALVDTTRKLGISDSEQCDYGKLLSDLVGNSCVPGVRSPFAKESADCVDKDKLCEQCKSDGTAETATYCNDDVHNTYYGNQGAINCLLEKAGDFAVITRNDIANNDSLQVICKNNTLASTMGLNVDEDCALFIFTNSEVVAASTNTKIPDIKLALFEFEKWFGQYLKKSFYLFDQFNGVRDLLFLDSTPGLNLDKSVQIIEDYKTLLKNVKKCNTGSAVSTTVSAVLLICSFVLLVTNTLL